LGSYIKELTKTTFLIKYLKETSKERESTMIEVFLQKDGNPRPYNNVCFYKY